MERPPPVRTPNVSPRVLELPTYVRLPNIPPPINALEVPIKGGTSGPVGEGEGGTLGLGYFLDRTPKPSSFIENIRDVNS